MPGSSIQTASTIKQVLNPLSQSGPESFSAVVSGTGDAKLCKVILNVILKRNVNGTLGVTNKIALAMLSAVLLSMKRDHFCKTRDLGPRDPTKKSERHAKGGLGSRSDASPTCRPESVSIVGDVI